jgi:serine protease Do
MRRFVSYGPALVVLLTVIAVLVAGPAAVRKINSAQTSARIVLAQRALEDDDILERLNKAIRNVAETVRPSVVHIEVSPADGRRFTARSTGTGWLYDTAGHIVTNAHVVRGAAAVSVQFSDGRVVAAEALHGDQFVADPYTDIAVLKVASTDELFPARRATGLQPQQGDRVFVFGSPFGFKFSMSEGIVSGLGRDPTSAAEAGGYTNYIQTDAAVNPGNSGGPLVDIKGRVIGMNVAIATARSSDGTTADEGQSAGISFAIPLGTIESIVDQLIEKGEVKRGFMGIQFVQREVPVTDVVGFRGTGVGVQRVTDGGPAAKGGLRRGDIVVELNGQRVPEVEVLRSLVSSARPGEPMKVKVSREGEFRDLTVTLMERPPEEQANADRSAAMDALMRYGVFFGSRRMLPLDQPAVVLRVIPESPAAAAGFEVGQTVLQVGDLSTATLDNVLLATVGQGLLVGKRIQIVVAEDKGATSPPPRTIDLRVR